MKKLPILFVLVLVVSVLTTQAFATVPMQVQNGVVVGYTLGKGITIREYGDKVVDFNLTTNTKVIQPSDSNGTLDAGARVTVVAWRLKTTQADGWMALAIIVRSPANTISAGSSTASPTAQPTAQPTATP